MLFLESWVAFQLTVYVCVYIYVRHVADFVFRNLKQKFLSMLLITKHCQEVKSGCVLIFVQEFRLIVPVRGILICDKMITALDCVLYGLCGYVIEAFLCLVQHYL
jgi:hypothetical protein